MCSVFWLFWLSYQYLPSDWLEILLWGSLCGEGIVSTKPGPKSAYDSLGLNIIFFHCFKCLCCLMALRDIFSYCCVTTHDYVCAKSAVKHQAKSQTIIGWPLNASRGLSASAELLVNRATLCVNAAIYVIAWLSVCHTPVLYRNG